MNHKHLFHIRNKQHLLYTSGNFHAIRTCQRKGMMKQQRVQFFPETRCIWPRVESRHGERQFFNVTICTSQLVCMFSHLCLG